MPRSRDSVCLYLSLTKVSGLIHVNDLPTRVEQSQDIMPRSTVFVCLYLSLTKVSGTVTAPIELDEVDAALLDSLVIPDNDLFNSLLDSLTDLSQLPALDQTALDQVLLGESTMLTMLLYNVYYVCLSLFQHAYLVRDQYKPLPDSRIPMKAHGQLLHKPFKNCVIDRQKPET